MSSGKEGPVTSTQLWEAAEATAQRATHAGALQPIDTVERMIDDGPIRFAVREVSSLLRKFAAQANAAPARNPFLPFEPALHVADLGNSHVLILNKFPVLAGHLLVITREFVPQETLLQCEDFRALADVMAGRPCVAFYNAGRDAGASQPHRHLQLVPLPLESTGTGTPIDAVVNRYRGQEGCNQARELGYNHALGWVASSELADPDTRGRALYTCYRRLLGLLDIGQSESAGALSHATPYNLIATRDWMLVVPRARERYEGISVNALGFAGSLFVKDQQQLDMVVSVGPRAVLRAVT